MNWGVFVLYKEVFDFGDIATLEVTREVEGFQPRFDNCLALTAYDDQRTLVLTLAGQLLVVKTSLAACLREFSQYYQIHGYEMDVYYALVHCQTQGLIAGHYRLVPSQRASNPHVVYYNAHFIDSKSYSKERQRVLLTLNNGHDSFQLCIDACYSSFVRILAAAELVSKYQLQNIEAEMRRLGMRKEPVAIQGSQDVFQCQRDADQFHTHLQSMMIVGIITAAFENSYGQKPDAIFNRSLASILNYSKFIKKDKKW